MGPSRSLPPGARPLHAAMAFCAVPIRPQGQIRREGLRVCKCVHVRVLGGC